MSLFNNKADRDLPFLTQFYQVDMEDASETEDFIIEQFGRLFAGGMPSDNQREWWHSLFRTYPVRKTLSTTLRKFHALTRDIMDYMADNKGMVLTKPISDLLHYEVDLRTLLWFRVEEMNPSPKDRHALLFEEIPREKLLSYFTNEELAFSYFVLQELCKLVQEKEPKVRRCVTCGSSYILRNAREENRFCSQRCQARARMRRLRGKKKMLMQQAKADRISAQSGTALSEQGKLSTLVDIDATLVTK